MRSSSPAERRRRLRVVSLRLSACSFTEIAAQSGLSRTGALNICKRIEASGSAALDDAANLGRRSQLGAVQAAMVNELISAHTL
jgi:transposase